MTGPARAADLQPELTAFSRAYEAGKPQVVWRTCPSDLETPVSAYLKLTGGAINSFLLESVEGGETLARYSIIGLEPDLIWRANGDSAEMARIQNGETGPFQPDSRPTLDSLRALLRVSQIDLPDDVKHQLPPMFAGVFGFFGYDVVRLTERLDTPAPNDLHVPDAVFVRPSILAVFDNVRQELVFISPVRPVENMDAATAYRAADARLGEVIDRLMAPLPDLAQSGSDQASLDFSSNVSDSDFLEMVARAKDYIAAGDIFQVVLSQRYSAAFDAHPISLYRSLRRLNPSPFLFMLNLDGLALVGSSPEILVRVRDGEVTIRPIAGTRPRGTTAQEDIAQEEDLLADPKERAEHLMLLDLGRNDVGRSAKPGSVRVTDQFTIERYSHVMHIVSNVTGQLDERHDAVSALFHGFPAGTVSGAPKIRAMDIITELEPDARGPYGGCIGYFSADGNVDTCIALRTALITEGRIHIQAGAGIVADSEPYAENMECRHKAGALMQAAKHALGGANIAPRDDS